MYTLHVRYKQVRVDHGISNHCIARYYALAPAADIDRFLPLSLAPGTQQTGYTSLQFPGSIDGTDRRSPGAGGGGEWGRIINTYIFLVKIEHVVLEICSRTTI